MDNYEAFDDEIHIDRVDEVENMLGHVDDYILKRLILASVKTSFKPGEDAVFSIFFAQI